MEERFELYSQLIQKLLASPSEQYSKILQDNSELVDLGLLVAIQDVASLFAEDNNLNTAEFLQRFAQWLARQMNFSSVDEMYQEYFNCLSYILEQIQQNPTEEAIFPLLKKYQEKLNLNLGVVLYIWVQEKLTSIESEKAQLITQVIGEFAGLIQKFPLVNIANNLELAIVAYQTILFVFTETDFPLGWAKTQHNLAIAYNQRIKGDKAKNVEQAILHSKNALSIYTKTNFPTQWAMTQNVIGNTYINKTREDKTKDIEQAILHYENALRIYTQKDFPVQWSTTQFYLGNAYLSKIKGKKANNIEQAILHFKDALQVRTRENSPVQWAMTKNNLGNAYLDRIKGNKAENIEQAILHFKDALQVRTRENSPVEWAVTQHNIGNAYRDRIQKDKVENLEQAILHYNNALKVRKITNLPEKWAMTKHNLAVAYLTKASLSKIGEDNEEDIKEAIKHEKKALEIFTENDYPEDWARIQLNLVAVYAQKSGDNIKNFKQAIFYAKNACRVYKEASFRFEYATTQMNLASVYMELHKIEKDEANNIELAIATLQNVLQTLTEIDFPVQWAMTQHNLGLAYEYRIPTSNNNNIDNLNRAVVAYQNALRIYTETDFPINCLRTAKNLGDLYFTQGNWQLAIQNYQKAISAIEITRNWATKDLRRQEIIAESMNVYEKMIQACINNEQLELAIETTERSRARTLVDLMASNDVNKGGVIPEAIKEYLKKYEHLQERISFLRSFSQAIDNWELATSEKGWRNRETLSAELAEINQLETEKQKIWLQLRRLDPILAGQQQVAPISFTQIQKLINNNSTAILCFYSTSQDTHIFIIYKDRAPQVHTCIGQKINILQDQLIRKNWLFTYLEKFSTWRDNIPQILAKLSQCLKLDRLIEQHLQSIEELIIIPHLLLHQIPFAALPVNSISPTSSAEKETDALKTDLMLLESSLESGTDSRGMGGRKKKKKNVTFIPEDRQYLGDLFRLRILPSCQILNYCHQRPNLTQQKTMGIVENATGDLPYTAYECETLTNQYQVESHRRLQQSRATISQYRRIASEVPILHSSHHGSVNPNNSSEYNPLESALILSDGNLTLGELLTPGWRNDLQNLSDVYLNNCETNFSINEITDDLLSIATGFLCAGARSVVSTLWSVDDCASALLAIFYYEEYRKPNSSEANSPRSLALQEAQEKLRTLTGKQLEKEYLESLNSNLNQQYQQAIANTQATQNSEEREKYQQLADKIQRQIQNTLPDHCKQEYPFANPYYWAGFISQGLA